MRKHQKRCRVHVDFMDCEKAYDSAKRETLWQVLGVYDGGSKLLIGIKSMYIDSLARVSKGDE